MRRWMLSSSESWTPWMCWGKRFTTPNSETALDIFKMSSVNEALIRDVVAQVLGRLGQSPGAAPAPSKEPCGCGNGHISGGSIGQSKFGVFQDANEAGSAAHQGFLQLKQTGVAARPKVAESL